MTEKLRSHLKNEKGFTLIELLVVIAIIAILVVIVLVAINPVERINEANRRSAQSDVRQVATGVEACITKYLGDNPGALETGAAAAAPLSAVETCSSAAYLIAAANSYLKSIPTGVTVESTAAFDIVCVRRDGGARRYWYKTHNDATSSPQGTVLQDLTPFQACTTGIDAE